MMELKVEVIRKQSPQINVFPQFVRTIENWQKKNNIQQVWGLIHCLVKSTGGQYSSDQRQPRSVPGLWAWPCHCRADICCGGDHQVVSVPRCEVSGGGSGGGEDFLVSECHRDDWGQPGVCCKLSPYITTLQHLSLTSHHTKLSRLSNYSMKFYHGLPACIHERPEDPSCKPPSIWSIFPWLSSISW